MRNLIYAVDISGASDISGLKAKNGMELETVRDMKDLNGLGVKPASKELLVDLRKFGWTAEKAEGIALLDDGRTLAICSDNDFGIGLNFKNPSADENGKKVSKITKYTLRDGALFLDGKKSDAAIEIVPTGETQAFWLIKMPEKIR